MLAVEMLFTKTNFSKIVILVFGSVQDIVFTVLNQLFNSINIVFFLQKSARVSQNFHSSCTYGR